MPEQWAATRLGDLVSIKHGFAFPGEFFSDQPTTAVLLTPGNFRVGGGFKGDKLKYYGGEPPAEYILKPDDLIVSMTDLSKNMDTLGFPARVPDFGEGVALHNQRLGLVEPISDSALLDFIFYVMCSTGYRHEVLASSTGTTVHHTSPNRILNYEFELPPLAEQRGIAAILCALDDKIESNRRRIDRASQLAKALFDAAVSGHESVLAADVMSVRMGSAFKGDFFTEPGLGRPLLRIRDLKTFTSQVWTTEQRDDEVVILPGDIVVGMDAEFRATLWLGEASLLNQRVCSFVGEDHVGRAYVLHALAPELSFMEAAKTGTTVIHLNKSDIAGFRAPALTVDEHRRLADSTEPLFELEVASASESRKLELLRDVLLPELLSGRIRVPEAADAVAEVIG